MEQKKKRTKQTRILCLVDIIFLFFIRIVSNIVYLSDRRSLSFALDISCFLLIAVLIVLILISAKLRLEIRNDDK